MKKFKEKEIKKRKIFEYELAYIGIAMIMATFIGYLAENIGRLIDRGILDNRYMILPFIAPYGLAILAMYVILGTPNKIHFFGKDFLKIKSEKTKKIISNLLYWSILCILVPVIEIILGTLLERLTGIALWNYTDIPLNFTKYASVPTSFLYGTGAYLLMKFCFTPFMKLLQRKMSYKAATMISLILGSLIILDCIAMIIITIITKQAPIYWSIII